MNTKDAYGYLCRLIQKDYTEEIFNFYAYIIRSNVSDIEIIRKMMFYMYKIGSENEYIMLLRRISNYVLRESELAFYTAFYFLMKKSSYHSYISFSMVQEKENAELYSIAVLNMKKIRETDKKLSVYLEGRDEDTREKGRQIFTRIESLVKKTIEDIKHYDNSKKTNLFDF